jgi:uncharacterized protein YjlB
LTQEYLEARLRAEGLSPSAWSNQANDRYGAHSHAYDKILVVAQGSITFHLVDLGRDVHLETGDRLELPASTRHAATVGAAGVTCMEAHQAAGTLDGEARLRASGW